ncbi:MAG: hypothetical protein KAV87_02405 [Desulfobacteraceae bacterium]|nr:hypothetical protein [Desulfobacteraceae bacterium]
MPHSNKTQAEEDQLTAAYQRVFMGKSTAQEGQLVFWDLINKSYLFRPFNQQNAGAYAMEGKREIGIEIMTRVNLMPNMGGVNALQVMEELKKTIDSVDKLKKTAK